MASAAQRASKAAVGADERTGPPVLFLVLAGLCVATGVTLLVQGDQADQGVHVLGYLSSSVLAIVQIGLFRRFDLSRRLTPGYVPRPGMGRAVTVLLLAGFAVAGLHVWALATELAS
jgi:hypothetical protein